MNAPDPRLERPGPSNDARQAVHATVQREPPEPSEGTVPIPMLLLALICALVFFAGTYLGRYSGGFDPLVYNEQASGGAATAAGPAPVDPVAVGKRLFTQNCVQCHQTTGLGIPGTYPPLAGSDWVTGPEDRVARVLLHGLSGPIQVGGETFGSAPMPAFGPAGANWKDDRIAAVLTYIRQEWGNRAGPVSPEQVARVRTEAGPRTKAWTAAELLAPGTP